MDSKRENWDELYFPTKLADRYEYILQKAKKVLADGELVVRFSKLRPGPGTQNPENFPSTIVELELIGIPFEHPVTKRPIISKETLQTFFERTDMQRAFVGFLCGQVSSTITDDAELRGLKRKLANITEGRPSNLPPRLDLFLLYYEVLGQVQMARLKLDEIRGRKSLEEENLKRDFLAVLPPDFWWRNLLEAGTLTLLDVTGDVASSVAQMILARVFDVSLEAIHSRLWPRKSEF